MDKGDEREDDRTVEECERGGDARVKEGNEKSERDLNGGKRGVEKGDKEIRREDDR